MEWVWVGFGIGLMGSFHCAGMCGPIVLALPLQKQNALAKNVLYQLGRIVSYSLIGLLFGFVGRGFSLAGLQQPLSIAIGVFMIASVLLPRVINTHKTPVFLQKIILLLRNKLGKLLKQNSFKALFITGILNGFLPCGLVYMALLGAIGIGNPFSSALFMAFFGLGTFPMMFTIAFSQNIISLKWRRVFTKMVPYFIVILGILFIARGLGYGIKYISPSDEVLQVNTLENCD